MRSKAARNMIMAWMKYRSRVFCWRWQKSGRRPLNRKNVHIGRRLSSSKTRSSTIGRTSVIWSAIVELLCLKWEHIPSEWHEMNRCNVGCTFSHESADGYRITLWYAAGWTDCASSWVLRVVWRAGRCLNCLNQLGSWSKKWWWTVSIGNYFTPRTQQRTSATRSE